jgi:two-component system sensor histidine kinase KdpD
VRDCTIVPGAVRDRTTLWRGSFPLGDRIDVAHDRARDGVSAVTDEFLEFLRGERRGRLKIYLGMAAGVGKTVAMLREAKRLASEGVDVVCAIVETHGRDGTLRELEGIECVPRKTIVHKGVPLTEMDVEAVRARKPSVALVDELAHTNAPGSRSEKRWQDVDALLSAGISVIGTLNVQHLESLHDLVLRETGVDVRERVPDRFVRAAQEVVVVDLPPAELQERLRAGLIYPAHKIEHALGRFFKLDNLAALRQLALREVANAVERRAALDEGSTPDQTTTASRAVDAERVMVCMSSRPMATRRLLRHGARLAGGPNSRWFVVYVRTPSESVERIGSAELRSLADNIRLATELGAEIVRLEGTDIVAALARFSRDRRITHAVFGRTGTPAWKERLRGTVLSSYMRAVPEVDVLVVGSSGDDDVRPDSDAEDGG